MPSVIGGDVAVADGPILAKAVAAFGLEVIVGEAQREPPPDIRFSAEAPRANPSVVRARERMLTLVDNNILDVVAAAHVAAEMLGLLKARPIGRIANGVLVERQRMRLRRKVSAMGVERVHHSQSAL